MTNDVELCSRHWTDTADDEHWCAGLIQPNEAHVCRCCCGAVDLESWDLPARLTPGLARSPRRRRAARS